MKKLLDELKQRWTNMFGSLAEGDDVPPALRLRAEGMMESVILSGDASALEVDAVMEQCYLDAFGKSLVEEFGADWREFYPFPQIPALGQRAPVRPSTKD